MRPRLLIAEGDHAWRRGLRILFANRGWEVTSASTVAEGLALLGPPLDFLILDWALPDAGGGVILRRVRDAGLRTRVAVTTETADADPWREVGELRPEAVFEKPVNVAALWREAGGGVVTRAGGAGGQKTYSKPVQRPATPTCAGTSGQREMKWRGRNYDGSIHAK